MTKEILYKKGDAGEVSHWRSLLINKMETLECDYNFIEKANYNIFHRWTAQMKITDTVFQRRPVVEIGYAIDAPDNLLLTPVILHEIGHVVDYKEFHSLERYWRHYGTLEMETRAWENAFKIAKELSFPHVKEMLKLALKCLGTYFDDTNFRERADSHYKFAGESPTRSAAMERIYKASM